MRAPPQLMRMNLLGPSLSLSFPLEVNAVMMLWTLALLGKATTWVLGMVRQLIIFIPAGNLQEVDCHLLGGLCLARLLFGRGGTQRLLV